MNDPRIQLISSGGRKRGPSAARNAGVRAASGDWVAFLDADDLWENTHIEGIAALVAMDASIGCAFSSWKIQYIGGKREQEPTAADVDGSAAISDGAIVLHSWVARKYCPLWTSAIAVNKSHFLEIGAFNESYRRGEDKEAWLRLLLSGNVGRSTTPTAIYRRDIPGQAVTSPPTEIHPVAITVRNILKDEKTAVGITSDLQRLSNWELWKYAKANRGRSALDHRFLNYFYFTHNPVYFCMTLLIFTLSRLRATTSR